MTARAARFALWGAAVLGLATLFATRVVPQMRVETDILAMLPEVERDPVVEQAVQALAGVSGQTLLFLAGAPDFARARAAAGAFAATLEGSGAFARVRLEVARDAEALDTLYQQHRAVLLSGPHRAALAEGRAEALVQESLRALYTPAGWVRARPFSDDPLNLYGAFLTQLLPAGGRLRLEQGVLTVAADEGGTPAHHVLVTAQLAGSAFATTEQQRAMPALAAARDALAAAVPGARLLTSGVLPHAAANSEQAKREISTFGSLSLAGVVLLVLATFRGPRPLLLTLGCIGISVMAALTACHFLFDRIHVVTLVFGSTLIGVAVDYSIHWFCDQFRGAPGGDWSQQETFAHVGPAIGIGMLATALGYQALLLPPFPGLRQMAVFSIAGVAAACVTVLGAYPLLAGRRRASHRPALLRHVHRLERVGAAATGRRGAALAAALVVLAAVGLWRLDFVDDIRALPAAPPELQEQEARVRELLGNAADTRFLLVEAADEQALLEAEERLRIDLDRHVRDGVLADYQAVSRAVPSPARLRQDHALLAQHVYAPGGALERLLAAAGYDTAQIERARGALPIDPPGPLTVSQWQASPAADGLRHLWLGDTGRGVASAITLAGVRDAAALAVLERPGVRFVDRVARISEVMARYRTLALGCLAGALALIGAALMLRYGRAAGLWLVAAPAGAMLLTLATLGWVGATANLFNVLALLLVLGMGVDYSVFLRQAGSGARATVLMAIVLAGLMTLLAFGLLAFSATPFIRSIGLTVLIGVFCTFGLALACAPRAAAGDG